MTTSTTGVKRNFGKKIAGAVFALLFWLGVWYVASAGVGKELILPSPLTVFQTLLVIGATQAFWASAAHSLLSVFAGFVAGVAAGTLFAALTSWNRVTDIVLSPVIRIVRATPVASFIILALLWIGKTRVPAFCSALMVTPVVWQSVTAAIGDTDKDLLEMARMYGLGKLKTLRLVYIPSVRSDWSAACVTSMGLAWKSGIAAEVLCQAKPSIGADIYYSKIYLETPALFAWTGVVILLSLILEKGFAALFRNRRGEKN